MQVVDVFEQIHDVLSEDRLTLPTLPDIALRIHRVASDPDCNFDTIGRVLKRDTAMSAQLVRVANSPLYRSRVPVTNVRSAVHRLGVPAVRNVVTTLALKNLFGSENKALAPVFRQLWEQSTEVATLTSVLATSCAGFDPDDALLAGLLQDIGAVTLLGQLVQLPEPPDRATVLTAIEEWAPRLGALVLAQWDFDRRFIEVARARHDWHVDLHSGISLVDVVTVARLHYYRSTGLPGSWPEFEILPAYRKLPVRALTGAGTLKLLDDAADEVSRVRSMLRD